MDVGFSPPIPDPLTGVWGGVGETSWSRLDSLSALVKLRLLSLRGKPPPGEMIGRTGRCSGDSTATPGIGAPAGLGRERRPNNAVNVAMCTGDEKY